MAVIAKGIVDEEVQFRVAGSRKMLLRGRFSKDIKKQIESSFDFTQRGHCLRNPEGKRHFYTFWHFSSAQMSFRLRKHRRESQQCSSILIGRSLFTLSKIGRQMDQLIAKRKGCAQSAAI
jgi:hypothetical protein